MKKNRNLIPAFLILAMIAANPVFSFAGKNDKKEGADTLKAPTFSGLKFRSIGPAFKSGRIADFAVNPLNPSEYYVAVACGNIWKTTNSGITFNPVFDNYGAYSIGCLAMDPKNHHVVWAGTGENNHQRALGYGDGVYKTIDGGKSWKNMGLKDSRQIGMIAVHPSNTDIVFVAAEGSVWGPGGDRGLYRTDDGGKNWTKVLEISEHTGVNNVIITPGNPDIMFATSEQRRRHVHTKIGGGPESAIYRSTDGGENWEKLSAGLPSVDKGGIGIAVSPVNPDVIFAIIEAAEGKGGFFRSKDRGASWEKMSDHTASGQYYNEIYCDPLDVDKIYSLETRTKVTKDGGKTWKNVGGKYRHVDDHALWIDPDDTEHFLIGGDGGVYETFDGGKNYLFKSNLPVTQFYRVNVDNTEPFYWVYGGTQDNSSIGGPSRNTSTSGVTRAEWKVTLGGDGFWQAIDPENPDIVYSEYQYGNITRYDRKSGENISIKPQPGLGENTFRWNWNTPLIISPYSNTRLYCAANKVFRSDNRGNSWKAISDDLTAQIDRNSWPVMGKYWSMDAVVKDVSTSLFGTIVSLVESPVKEDLLYIGTDDGLIQVTENAGIWQKIDDFPGVPQYTYVSDILASRFDENIVFASFDNRKRDDFKPYILKSTNKGESWKSISGDLPENGTVHTIVEDFVNPQLLFAGTEFGVYFTYNGGENWVQLKSGIPTISVRDMVVQERENDLVLATFGRGFYILDDYSPLREITSDILEKDAAIFPVKDALMYVKSRGADRRGSTDYVAANPPFGATFTYYLKEIPVTKNQQRKKNEKELFEKSDPIPMPDKEAIKAEKREIPPHLIFIIKDDEGNVVRKLYSKPQKGINKVTWDLRYQGTSGLQMKKDKFNVFTDGSPGITALPGEYSVSMSLFVDGEVKEVTGPVEFNAVLLNNSTLPQEDREEVAAFQKEASNLYRAMRGTEKTAVELAKRLEYIKQAVHNMPDFPLELMNKVAILSGEVNDIIFVFRGADDKPSKEENPPGPVPLNQRMNSINRGHWRSLGITETMQSSYDILTEEFPPLLERIREIAEVDIKELENELDNAGAPWTPGRIPVWKKE